ncbi:MAG TPA: WXG100 family type VII secretion target [Acetivibrio sp.]|jgi:WXG100 family type VII secretion target|nr:WXG100 family type VII secretion target [Clostridium sp.]HQA57491.1 WXG100 family type VII secretion target [Acetivibrio sp.]
MATIKITPEELRDAAQLINGKADEIDQNINAVNEKVQYVVENWEGAAKDSFFEAFESLKNELLTQLDEILKGIASQLQAAADTMEQADQDVANVFKG